MSLLHGLAAFLRQLLLTEQRCASCLMPFVAPPASALSLAKSNAVLCSSCLAALTVLPKGQCPRCGLPYPTTGQHVCGTCLAAPPPWDNFMCVGAYKDMLRDVLLRGKFKADGVVLDALGRVAAEAWKKAYRRCDEPIACATQTVAMPDGLVPMPLHTVRLCARGFNQCVELARPIAHNLNIPLQVKWLVRQKNTISQRGLSATRRKENLHGAFIASPMVHGRHLLLLDDVMTTGATLRHAVTCLKSAGAARVDVLVVARVGL